VWWIPQLPLLIGASLCATALMQPPPPLWMPLLGVAALAWGVSEIRRLTRVRDRVVIRGLRVREELGAGAAIGYTVRSSGRSASIDFYITDGEQRRELWSMMPFGADRADRVVARVSSALGLRPTGDAAAIVVDDRQRVAESEAPIKAYYASATHRRTTIGIFVALAIYVVVMGVMMALER
jgi:hypothetical protein